MGPHGGRIFWGPSFSQCSSWVSPLSSSLGVWVVSASQGITPSFTLLQFSSFSLFYSSNTSRTLLQRCYIKSPPILKYLIPFLFFNYGDMVSRLPCFLLLFWWPHSLSTPYPTYPPTCTHPFTSTFIHPFICLRLSKSLQCSCLLTNFKKFIATQASSWMINKERK